MFIVFGSELQELPGRLHVVQVGVQVRKQDRHLASSIKKVRNLKVKNHS